MKLSKKLGVIALISGLMISTAPSAMATDLVGQGASFPALLIEECKVVFSKTTGHSLTYAATGSGTGRDGSDKQLGHSSSSSSNCSSSQLAGKDSTLFISRDHSKDFRW
jgi:ABC-type phosphate transport system substrate-binding protein